MTLQGAAVRTRYPDSPESLLQMARSSANPDWYVPQLVALFRDDERMSAGDLLTAGFTGQELWNGGFFLEEIYAGGYTGLIDTTTTQVLETEISGESLTDAIKGVW